MIDIDNKLLALDSVISALGVYVADADLTVTQNYTDIVSEREPFTTRYIPTHREAKLTLTIVGSPDTLLAIAQRSEGTIRIHGN